MAFLVLGTKLGSSSLSLNVSELRGTGFVSPQDLASSTHCIVRSTYGVECIKSIQAFSNFSRSFNDPTYTDTVIFVHEGTLVGALYCIVPLEHFTASLHSIVSTVILSGPPLPFQSLYPCSDISALQHLL